MSLIRFTSPDKLQVKAQIEEYEKQTRHGRSYWYYVGMGYLSILDYPEKFSHFIKQDKFKDADKLIWVTGRCRIFPQYKYTRFHGKLPKPRYTTKGIKREGEPESHRRWRNCH